MTSLQPILLAAVLLWSARLKTFSRYAEATARRSPLARLLGDRRAVPAYRGVGVIEAAVAVLLLVRPSIGTWACAGLGVGFVAYLAYGRLFAKEASCGCMSAQPSPIRARSFLRAFLVIALALIPVPVSLAGAGVIVGEALLFAALSSELDRHWLVPLRRLKARWTHPLASPGDFPVPVASSVEQLQRSSAYREIAASLRSDLREHWDEGEWRLLLYSVTHAGVPASVVFAVPRLRYAPTDVRAAVVAETGETLATLLSTPQPEYAI